MWAPKVQISRRSKAAGINSKSFRGIPFIWKHRRLLVVFVLWGLRQNQKQQQQKGGFAAKVNKWKKKAKADRKTMETQNWNKHERLKCCSPPFSVGYPITWFIGPTIQTDEKKFKFKFPFFPPFIFFKGLLCVLHNSYIITLSLSGLLGKRKKRERGGKRNKI